MIFLLFIKNVVPMYRKTKITNNMNTEKYYENPKRRCC